MGFDFKKNEKLNKVITIILVGVLILIVIMPVKKSSDVVERKSADDVSVQNSYEEYYERRLKGILEDSYGEGTMQVMVHVSDKAKTEGIYGASETELYVDGVLIVANVDNQQAVSDITYAVCALFDLPAHKVAVMIKK